MSVVRRHPNVLVLHTFSKIHALAGARVGYALGTPFAISMLERARQPFNVSSLAAAAAAASLGDQDFVRRARMLNEAGLRFLMTELPRFGLKVFPSQGNFVLVDAGAAAPTFQSRLLDRGVMVRGLQNYGMPECFRITVGSASELDRLLAALGAKAPGAGYAALPLAPYERNPLTSSSLLITGQS
jgi:histidinol-phosphate aminotransferase